MSNTINNEANREEESGIKREKVRVVPLKFVDDFPNHPFRVKDDDEMKKLVESIREYGVLITLQINKQKNYIN